MHNYLSLKKLTDKERSQAYTFCMDPKKLLATNIVLIRKAEGLTQTALAKRINITRKHLCKIEKGETFPSSEILGRIAEGLSVPVKTLFSDPDDYREKDIYTQCLRAMEKTLPEISQILADAMVKEMLKGALEE